MDMELLLEAEKRGILPAEKQTLLDEARRRGLVGGGAPGFVGPPSNLAPPEEPNVISEVGNWGKRRGRDLFEGFADMLDTPANLIEILTKVKPPVKLGEKLREATGIQKNERSDSALENLQQDIFKFGGGLAVGPGSAPLKLGMSIGGGSGGYIGDKFGGSWGRLLGELLGAGPAALIGAKTPNTVKVAKGILEGEGEKSIRDAASRAKQMTDAGGVPVSVAQGVSRQGSQLEALGEMISSVSPSTQRILSRQQEKGLTSLADMISELSSLPINQKTANRVAEAGSKAVALPEKNRSASTKHLFEALNQIPMHYNDLRSILQAVISKRGEKGFAAESDSGQIFNELARKYDDMSKRSQYELVTAAEANDPAKFLGNVAHRTNEKGAIAEPTTKELAGARVAAAKAAKDKLSEQVPEIGVANEAFQLHSRPVARMEASGMPDFFPPYSGDAASMKKMAKILETSPEQIDYAARMLRFTDPEAFGAIVKAHWARKLDKAMKSGTDQVPKDAMEKAYSSIAGTAEARANSLASIRAHARTIGADPDVAVANAEKVFDLLATYSRMRGGQPLDRGEIFRAAGGNALSSVLRTPGALVGASPAAAALDRLVAGKTLDKLSDLLLRPAEVEKLLAFIKTVPGERRADALSTYFMGVSGGADSLEKQ